MLTNKIVRYGVVVLLVGISFAFWLWIFTSVNSPRKSTSEYTDSLSGQPVNMLAINGDVGANPNMPYFVGFNYLTKYGSTDDDQRYIQDSLTNYILYDKKLSFAKVSYVNESFLSQESEDTSTIYSFKVGINDSDIHTVEVSSDIVTQKISIKILDNKNTQVFDKEFIIYSI